MNTTLWIILGIALVAVFWLIGVFNRLVTLRNRAKEALSDIDVQLKRRYDLIPNLMETVKVYMAHERGVLEGVTEARVKAMQNPGTPLEKNEAENFLSGSLKTLFAVAENYPDLKANTNFLELQRELADTENKIQASRRFYNSNIRDLNTKIESFPARLVAKSFGFSQMKFFEVIEPEEKEPIQVDFSK